MKIKKIMILIVTLLLVMLLQVNVNAVENDDYSEFNYLVTEEGIVKYEDLTGTEVVVAGIKGTSTEGVSVDVANRRITIKNFTAEKIQTLGYELWIEGENFVDEIHDSDGFSSARVLGYGKITTKTYIFSHIVGYSSENWGVKAYYIGGYIDSSVKQVNFELAVDGYGEYIDLSGDILQQILDCLKLDGDISYYLYAPRGTVIPASIFAVLKETNKSLSIVEQGDGFQFDGANITNPNSDFTLGVEKSYGEPIGNMTYAIENATYISFDNTGSFPGKVLLYNEWGGGTEFIEKTIYIYSYDEETKLYKYEGSCIAPNGMMEPLIEKPVGKYVASYTMLPDEVIFGKKDNEETGKEDTKEPEKEEETATPEDNKPADKKPEDTTTAQGSILYAGSNTVIIIAVLVLVVGAIILHIKNKDLRGI